VFLQDRTATICDRDVMSEISERYARLADEFAATIAGVPPDRWSAPSPCEGWTARDVVRHVVETPDIFLRLVGREMPDVGSVDDPAAAFDASRKIVQADLEDPERANVTFEGMFGTMTFAESIDRFISFDLVVHRWDLAHATGQDETIDPDDVRRARDATAGFGDALRSDGVCGPALDPPAGADEQTKLLAFLGRKAW
jgi:uncharacterized protein (TIGR03086 family)